MKKNAPGCCGCGVPALQITVSGCGGLPLAGAVVTVTQGATTIASYTSSGAAHYILVPAAGAYTVTATKARFAPGSVAVTAVAGSTVPVSLTLTAAAGYQCCTACADPYPETLYFEYAGRHITLTYGTGGATGAVGWHGTAIFNSLGYRSGGYGGCTFVGTIPVPFFYSLYCPGTGGLPGWTLAEYVWVCGGSGSSLVTDEQIPGTDSLRVWRQGIPYGWSYGICVIPLDADVVMTALGGVGVEISGHLSETPTGSTGTLDLTVTGCNGIGLQGALVSAVQGAVTVTASTDGLGHASLTLATGSWSVTVSRDRFATSSPSSPTITTGGSTSLAVPLAPAAGYACIGGCVLPVKTTLTLLNSGFGSGPFSLVYNGAGRWVGCHTISRLGKAFSCTTDALVDTPVVYEFVGSDGSLVYRDRTCIASFTVFLLAGLCSNTNGGPWTTSRTSFACPPSFGATYATPSGTVTFGAPVTLTLSEP